MSSKPTSLLFDFGNVIIDIDIPGATRQIGALRSKKVTEDEFRKEVVELVLKYEVGSISTDIFINGILRHSRPDVQALDVITAWNSMLIGIPEYRLAALEMIRQEYSLYMLSNTNALHIEWVDNHLEQMHGISDLEQDHFHDVYYSHRIGKRKPDREAFQYVIDNSFINPEKTLFIDDTEENIESARAMGFQVLLSPPEHEIAEYLKLEGYF